MASHAILWLVEQPLSETEDVKRRNAQHLYARGFISLDEYDALGRLHGFVQGDPAPPSSLGSKVKTTATVAALALTALTATAQIASAFYPHLHGPLETMLGVLRIVLGGQ